MIKQYFDFKVHFQIATRVTDTSMSVSYVVRDKNPFCALRAAVKLLSSEFKHPHIYGFIVNLD